MNMNNNEVISKLVEEVSEIKNMFAEMLTKLDIINNSINKCSCNTSKSSKIIKYNSSHSPNILGIEALIENKTDVSISLTDYLNNLNINKDDLNFIFESKTYQDGFMMILNKYINPENINQTPLRSFEDKRGKIFYAYDENLNLFSQEELDNSNEVDISKNNIVSNNKKCWFLISSSLLASKFKIIHKKIMSLFCLWQNENLNLLESNNEFQENYREQITKLTGGSIDKLIQSNSPFRYNLFKLLLLN